jgi:predicted PurR-regulated permease PerM
MAESVVRRITWRNADIARVFMLGLIFLFLWKFFWMVYSALFLGLLAVLIAIILYNPARFFSRWVPFRLAFTLTVLSFLAATAWLLVTMIPQIVQQIPLLARQIPLAIAVVTDWIREQTGGTGDDQVVRQINQQLGEFVGRFVPFAFNMIGVVAGAIAIFTLAVFLASQPETYRDLLLRLVPPAGRDRARAIYDEAGRSLRNWVLGKAFSMALVGLFVWAGLTYFDVPGALVLGVVAALLEFIPTFGPTIAAAPGVISAFLISPQTALYVAIYYAVLQQVQNAITMPLVERRAVDIPPAALLIWQLMLAVGFGIIGLFVATPLLAVIAVAVRVLYVEPTEERSEWDRRDTGPAEGVVTLPTEDPNLPAAAD